MNPWSRRLACAALAWCVAAPALAERGDKDMPLEIDAGQVRFDGKRKVRTFSGGVEIRRGSLLIRAQQIELRETPEGEVAFAVGNGTAPASFRQKRDGVDELVEGQAQRIDYDSATETLKLDQQAQLKRWIGDKLAEDLSGQTIVYDHGRDTFEVSGGSNIGEAPGRVRAVVAPRSGASGVPRVTAPARPAASAPVRGAEPR
ncbi:MAG: lipopolysaccharide transport periplasmic protein LptA [Burkholderiales bacterium]|nr:lipopolysaccharide transport periplasmic protein LptA [Burkholderiales bacterium]